MSGAGAALSTVTGANSTLNVTQAADDAKGGAMTARSAFVISLFLSLVPGIACGGQPGALPEPGVIELLVIAAIAGIAVSIRKRRK